MAKQFKNTLKAHGNLKDEPKWVKDTRKELLVQDEVTNVLNEVLSDPVGGKFAILDIETGLADDYGDYMPEFKEPRMTQKGIPHASDKTIDDQLKDWLEQCPLNPLTAKVICVSYQRPNGTQPDITTIDTVNNWNEQGLLNLFWNFYKEARDNNWTLVGHNIKKFDLPMAVRRSWKYGIKPLYDLQAKPWEMNWIVDTMLLWGGGYGEKFISLDNLGQFLGFGKKTGKGKDFAKMLKTNHQAAVEYVNSEIKLLNNIANKIL